MDRVRRLLPSASGRSPVSNMSSLLNVLTPSVIVPERDKYYVFVYKAKTPNIRYDQHPFIVCNDVFKWGFSGLNVHWNAVRNYTWEEVISNLYLVNEDEIASVTSMPIALFKST